MIWGVGIIWVVRTPTKVAVQGFGGVGFSALQNESGLNQVHTTVLFTSSVFYEFAGLTLL